MRDYDHRLPQVVDGGAQDLQHLARRVGVEVAGRFVAEDDLGPADEGACAGDALLLPAGQFGRPVRQAPGDAQARGDGVEPLAVDLPPGDVDGQGDVLLGGQRGHEVEGLEHEAQPVAAQRRDFLVGQPGQVGVADAGVAGRRGVEAGHAVHQRRLAGAGGPHDGGELAAAEFHVDRVEGGHGGVAFAVSLGQAGRPGCWFGASRGVRGSAVVGFGHRGPSVRSSVPAVGGGPRLRSPHYVWCGGGVSVVPSAAGSSTDRRLRNTRRAPVTGSSNASSRHSRCMGCAGSSASAGSTSG